MEFYIFYMPNMYVLYMYLFFTVMNLDSTYLTILYISYIDVHQLVYERTNIYSNIYVL